MRSEDKVLELIISSLREEEKEFYKDTKVLIIGGAGFLGSWLAEAAHALGADVTILDNLSSGRRDNLRRLEGKEKFRLIVGDVVRDEIAGKYDLIFHGAAMPAPDMYMERPVSAALPDSIGLYRSLSLARESGASLVFMSSSEIYGDPEVIPTPESYPGKVDPIGPRCQYEESKRFGEALAISFYRQYGLPVKIARIFNTYGPRLDAGSQYSRVATRFIERALRGEPIEIHGDGLQTRSFTFVSDTVSALLKLGTCQKCAGGAFNIGSEDEITIIELAALVLELTGSRSPVVHTPPRPGDPRRRRPDISKAREYLGWSPAVSLREGLSITIEWYEERTLG